MKKFLTRVGSIIFLLIYNLAISHAVYYLTVKPMYSIAVLVVCGLAFPSTKVLFKNVIMKK